MTRTSCRYALGACLLGAALLGGAGLAAPSQSVRLLYEGEIHELEYAGYDAPRELDLSPAPIRRDTPWETVLSYYRMLAHLEDYQQVVPFTRLANGDPGRVPEDVPAFLAAARQIFSGKVWIDGEILFEDYTIYLYRYERSIPRLSGLPVRKFGEEYFIVQDLALVNDFVGRMSAARWDVEVLEERYPAPPAPPPPPAPPAVAASEPAGEEAVTDGSEERDAKLWWILGLAAILGLGSLALYLRKR